MTVFNRATFIISQAVRKTAAVIDAKSIADEMQKKVRALPVAPQSEYKGQIQAPANNAGKMPGRAPVKTSADVEAEMRRLTAERGQKPPVEQVRASDMLPGGNQSVPAISKEELAAALAKSHARKFGPAPADQGMNRTKPLYPGGGFMNDGKGYPYGTQANDYQKPVDHSADIESAKAQRADSEASAKATRDASANRGDEAAFKSVEQPPAAPATKPLNRGSHGANAPAGSLPAGGIAATEGTPAPAPTWLDQAKGYGNQYVQAMKDGNLYAIGGTALAAGGTAALLYHLLSGKKNRKTAAVATEVIKGGAKAQKAAARQAAIQANIDRAAKLTPPPRPSQAPAGPGPVRPLAGTPNAPRTHAPLPDGREVPPSPLTPSTSALQLTGSAPYGAPVAPSTPELDLSGATVGRRSRPAPQVAPAPKGPTIPDAVHQQAVKAPSVPIRTPEAPGVTQDMIDATIPQGPVHPDVIRGPVPPAQTRLQAMLEKGRSAANARPLRTATAATLGTGLGANAVYENFKDPSAPAPEAPELPPVTNKEVADYKANHPGTKPPGNGSGPNDSFKPKPAPSLWDQAKGMASEYGDNFMKGDMPTILGTAGAVGGAALLTHLLSKPRRRDEE